MPVWIVTGASRGLGAHLVRQFSARGHRVIAAARDEARLEALAAECAAAGHAGPVQPLALDLTELPQIGPRLRAAIEAAGGEVAGLVNNAGIGRYEPLVQQSEDELIATVHVNLTAAILATRAVLPAMLAAGRGHVVNIASDLARRPLAGMTAYVASKHGLAGFSHSLLREVKDRGVKVSLVNPGIIDTDFGGAAEGSRDEHWSLRPAVLASLVLQLVEQPGNVVVDELTVHPLGQGEF
jgi:short-subunit dehydrogenase